MRWKFWCKGLLGLNTLIICSWFAAGYINGEEEPAMEMVKAVISSKVEAEADSDENPKIALTFDDGPHPVYTKKLLDGLKERDVQATFFIIGRNVEGNEKLIKRMHKEGHTIGNHTNDHVLLTDLSDEDACEQVKLLNETVYGLTGEYPGFLRPPFGQWNEKMDCGREMMIVMWDIDPLDWTTKNTDTVVEKVVRKAKSNGIILLHDWYGSSVDAALRIVDRLQAEGYDFVTVDELLLD